MLITKNFVLLNISKTGSTFVRTVLKRVHGYNPPERILGSRKLARYRTTLGLKGLREIFTTGLHYGGQDEEFKDQHGSYCQLPRKYQDRKVVTIARNPFDRLVSMYYWRSWTRRRLWPEGSPEYARYPNFPELSFKECLDYQERVGIARLQGTKLKVPLGSQTILFILMVFKKPFDVLQKLDEDYIASGAYRADMPDLHLLRNDNLNRDLYDFLRSQTYAEEDIRFILDEERILPPQGDPRKDRDYLSYFSDENQHEIRNSERLLFRIFKDCGITY